MKTIDCSGGGDYPEANDIADSRRRRNKPAMVQATMN